MRPAPTPEALSTVVRSLREASIDLLQRLVREPSLLGQEHSAQALMRREFEALGLEVRQFEIDEAKIRDRPGYSPSILPYAGRTNVVGLHRPRSPVRGHSLILNGHIDVVPVGTDRLWTRPPFEPWIDGDRLHGRGAAEGRSRHEAQQ